MLVDADKRIYGDVTGKTLEAVSYTHLYDNLYQSALCRAKADWLIGINATRLFSILYLSLIHI